MDTIRHRGLAHLPTYLYRLYEYEHEYGEMSPISHVPCILTYMLPLIWRLLIGPTRNLQHHYLKGFA